MNEVSQKTEQKRTISQVFVFLLLGVFAVFSTLMVLLGAQMYRETIDQTDRQSERRVMFSYLNNIVRGNDGEGRIAVDNRNGIDMLVFTDNFDGEVYETLVYCYDGNLRELFASADQEFEPEYGEMICGAADFQPVMAENGLLKLQVIDTQDQKHVFHVALRCGQEADDE